MEKTDRQILGLLAEDGRMSYTDLGKATGLSTSAVHQRVKRLEERGLILGYGATIDHAAAGKPLTAFVSITPIDNSRPDDYPDLLMPVPEMRSLARFYRFLYRELHLLRALISAGLLLFPEPLFPELTQPHR